jgi:hypothetical protein
VRLHRVKTIRCHLARQGEGFDVDYKRIYDIQKNPKHRLRLVKLVAALTALGGDAVVGVDPLGVPTGLVAGELANVYDEANLRSILLGYLPQELRIHSQTHLIDGQRVVIVRVERSETGPLAFTRDGIYENAKGEQVVEFRVGERYIREGTRNALFTGAPHQIALLLRQQSSAPPPADPAEAMSFSAPASQLAEAARELLRAQDDIPLRKVLLSAEPRLREGLAAQEWVDVITVLDGLSVLGSVYLTLAADSQASEVIAAVQRIFEIGFDESDVQRQASAAWSPRLWLEVTARAEILGGLAIRRRRWQLARTIGLWLPPEWSRRGYASWIQVAATASRHESWPRRDEPPQRPKSVPEVAAEIAVTLPQVSEDVAGDEQRMRESIGHFDFAVGLMCIADQHNAAPYLLLTDGRLLAGREGLTGFLKLIFPPGPAREAVFPLDDADLAVALRVFEDTLHRLGQWQFGWYGDTVAFIDRNYPRDASG